VGRRDAPASLQHDQEIVDRPVAQRVGELDRIAKQLVAFGRQENDVTLGIDLSRLPIPDHLVGG
jgi:hypothetical protein